MVDDGMFSLLTLGGGNFCIQKHRRKIADNHDLLVCSVCGILFTFAALCAHFVSEVNFCVLVVDFRRFLFHEAAVFGLNYVWCIKIIFVMYLNACR